MTDRPLGIVAPHPPIIVPEVGGERSRVTADTLAALDAAAAEIARYDPETLVLMSPHAPVVRDAFLVDDADRLTGDLGAFGAPHVAFRPRGDGDLARAIAERATDRGLNVHLRSESPRLDPGVLDHGALVPLYFLDRDSRRSVVVLSLAFVPLEQHRVLGEAVRSAADDLRRRVAFVASGDCSHRLTPDAPAGYSPRGADFDAALVGLIEHGDFRALADLDPRLIEAAGECGLRSFVALGGFMGEEETPTRVLAYEGPWGVGYLTAIVGGSLAQVSDAPSAPVALAREAIETYVRSGRTIPPPEPQGVLAERAGAFVSLHRGGGLRGCIGTIEPTCRTLAEEIVRNAIHAATADPRFESLSPDELDDLEISVDVLGAPEPAAREDLDPRRYGVIVSAGRRRGLLLPDLDGVDTVDEQVAIALRKAGIAPDEPYAIERFSVDRYH